MYLQYQNKLARVSVNSPQKEQESAWFRPILKRKSFVAIRSLLLHNRNFVSVVHRKGRQLCILPVQVCIFPRQPFSLAFKRGGLFFDN